MRKRQTSLLLALLALIWLLYAASSFASIGWLSNLIAPCVGWLAAFFVFRCGIVHLLTSVAAPSRRWIGRQRDAAAT